VVHELDPDRVHTEWDRELAPVARVASGDTLIADLVMARHGQIDRDAPFAGLDPAAPTYYLAGPVTVEGARPGTTLRIDVLSLEPGPWGWAAILPGEGVLPDRFPEPHLFTWDLDGDEVEIAPGIVAPLEPFLGTVGVHPGEPAVASVFPPHRGGGNMDNKHLVAGSTLWLPVWCGDVLLSFGDPHARQGDGEVCVTALECPMRAELRVTVEERETAVPMFDAPARAIPDAGGTLGTMGIHADLHEGARIAVGAMVDRLVAERGITPEEAYVACSLAGDLKILELVDAGVWNVGMTIPTAFLR
jgi:acetamidase/formamidase